MNAEWIDGMMNEGECHEWNERNAFIGWTNERKERKGDDMKRHENDMNMKWNELEWMHEWMNENDLNGRANFLQMSERTHERTKEGMSEWKTELNEINGI